MTPDASIVIPLYNNRRLTELCLDSIAAALGDRLGRSWELVLVDNGSLDDTAVLLDAWRERTTQVRFEENRAFARAVNAGVEAASGEIVVILNNDMEIPPGALETLAERPATPRSAWWAPGWSIRAATSSMAAAPSGPGPTARSASSTCSTTSRPRFRQRAPATTSKASRARAWPCDATSSASSAGSTRPSSWTSTTSTSRCASARAGYASATAATSASSTTRAPLEAPRTVRTTSTSTDAGRSSWSRTTTSCRSCSPPASTRARTTTA